MKTSVVILCAPRALGFPGFEFFGRDGFRRRFPAPHGAKLLAIILTGPALWAAPCGFAGNDNREAVA